MTITVETSEKIHEVLSYIFDTEYDDFVEMMGMDEIYTVGLTKEEVEKLEDCYGRSEEEIALVEKASKHPNCPHIYAVAAQIHAELNNKEK